MFYVRIYYTHPLVRSVFAEMLNYKFPLFACIMSPPGDRCCMPWPSRWESCEIGPTGPSESVLSCARRPERVGPTGNRGPPVGGPKRTRSDRTVASGNRRSRSHRQILWQLAFLCLVCHPCGFRFCLQGKYSCQSYAPWGYSGHYWTPQCAHCAKLLSSLKLPTSALGARASSTSGAYTGPWTNQGRRPRLN